MTKPAPIAVVICDIVYSESGGKTALVGLFNRITASRFPATHPRLCVYASATDIRPNTLFKLDIVHSETDHVVVTLEGPPPEETTPLTICDVTFDLRNLVFPEQGRYFVRFWGNEDILIERPFDVVSPKGEEKGP